MKKLLILCLSLLTLSSGVKSAMATEPLSGLTGKSRVVILFAKSRSSALLDSQVDRLRDRRVDLKERDMIVLVNEGVQETVAAIGYTDLRYGTARLLDEKFQPEPNKLTTVLIGKDGSEKGRWQGVVDPQILFDLVDTMPMRKDEVKQQSVTN